MNYVQTLFSSARFNRFMLWFGVAVFIAGALVLTVKLVGNTSGEESTKLTPSKTPPPAQAAPLKEHGTTVRSFAQLDPKIKATVRTFLDAAVARHNQARAWAVTTPNLHSGYTRKQWNKADALPVVPYPIANINRVNYSIDYATDQEILLEVGLSPKPTAKLRALTFLLGLAPVGKGAHKRWLVDYWMPRYTPPIPIGG